MKDKRSVTLDHKFTLLIEDQVGDSFSAKLETLIRDYLRMVKNKTPRAYGVNADDLNEKVAPSELDQFFDDSKESFSAIFDKQNAVDLLRRPVDNKEQSGYGQAPIEKLVDRTALLEEALSTLKNQMELVVRVSQLNAGKEAFKSKLMDVLDPEDTDIVLRLGKMLGVE